MVSSAQLSSAHSAAALAPAMASHKRVYLTLEKKVELIKCAPGHSLRSLEAMFGCGKTQISKVLKNKESILAEYQSNASSSRVHTTSKARASEYSEINDALYKWFKLATSKNIPIGGPHLINARRMRTRITVLCLSVCLSVCYQSPGFFSRLYDKLYLPACSSLVFF